MLVYQLTLILTKYQAKFSVEFMFILTILIVYAPAFMKARTRRKELKTPQVVTEVYNNPVVASAVASTVVENAQNVVNENPVNTGAVKPKRKRGNPGKA